MQEEYLGEFTIDNSPVICEIEKIINNHTNKLEDNLSIKEDHSSRIKMGYYITEGLKIIGYKNKKNNPLGEFLDIKKEDLNSIKSYFKKYGFLIPLTDKEYTRVSIEDINVIKDRLLAFLHIINNQNKSNLTISELLDSVLYLILVPSNIQENSIFYNYINQNDTLYGAFDTYANLSEKTNTFKYIKDESNQNIPVFSRFSSALNETIEMEHDLINTIENDNNTPNWCKQILKIFFILDNLELHETIKNKIELLFGIIYANSPFSIDNMKCEDNFSVEFYNNISKNKQLLNFLLLVSKEIIIEEFEHALKFVTPTYNVKKMKPDWKLPSLLSALYFSMYYRNSKNMIYKRCENTNCRMLFEVSNTNSLKKYCSSHCAASTNQRIYRQKKKQGN